MSSPGDLRAKALELIQDGVRRGCPVERGLGLVRWAPTAEPAFMRASPPARLGQEWASPGFADTDQEFSGVSLVYRPGCR